MIYEDGSSRLDIEFDGEYFQITQEIFELTESTISVTINELEQMLVVAKEIINS